MPKLSVVLDELELVQRQLEELKQHLADSNESEASNIIKQFDKDIIDTWKGSYIFLPPIGRSKCPHCGKDI
jgi:acetolactate synthase small subunit